MKSPFRILAQSIRLTVFKSVQGPKKSWRNLLGAMSNTEMSESVGAKRTQSSVDEAPDLKSTNNSFQELPFSGDDTKLARTEGDEDVQDAKLRKKKVAVLLSYSGSGYYGMLRQKPVATEENPVKTIEQDLFDALLKSDIIDKASYEEVYKCKFQRASRTDKGVSAVRSIVSLQAKLIDDLVENANKHLPPQIRCIAYKRVTRAFDSQKAATGRTYAYMMPTFALAAVNDLVTETYRVTQERIDLVNRLLALYKGTHNFHNFTSQKKFEDKSARRFMMSLECGKPFVRDGLEFVTIRIKGQSFMLHQIRKMIGLVIAVARGFASEDIIHKSYLKPKLDIPKAPSLGLMLEHVHYDWYNKKFGDDGTHEALTWDKYEPEVQAHADQFIYPTIIQTEKNEKSMYQWMLTLVKHTYDDNRTPGDNDADADSCTSEASQSKLSKSNGNQSSNIDESLQNQNERTEASDTPQYDDLLLS